MMLSFTECAEKLGHCWDDSEAITNVDGMDITHKNRCRHCGAVRRQEWVVEEPEKPNYGEQIGAMAARSAFEDYAEAR